VIAGAIVAGLGKTPRPAGPGGTSSGGGGGLRNP